MSRENPWLFVLVGLLSTANCSAFLVRRLRHEGEKISPIWVYSVTSFLRIGVAPIWMGAVLLTGESTTLSFGLFDPIPYLYDAYLILLIGEFAFFSGYIFCEGKLRKDYDSKRPVEEITSSLYLALSLIALGWLLRVPWSTPLRGLVQRFGTIVGYVMNYSIPAGIWLILANIRRRHGEGRETLLPVVLVVVFLLVELAYSLQSYMKTSTVVAILPLVLHILVLLKSGRWPPKAKPAAILSLLVLGVWVVAFLWTFSNIKRSDIWGGSSGRGLGSTWNYAQRAFVATVPGTDEFVGMQRFPSSGVWSFISRNQWIGATGWVVSEVGLSGSGHMATIRESLVDLVPRLLWPDKPAHYASREMAVRIGSATSVETATSATGLNLAAVLFWNGGGALLVIGMFVNGALLFLGYKTLQNYLNDSFFGPIAYLWLMVESLRWFESAFDGNIVLFTYFFLVFIPLSWLTCTRTRGRTLTVTS